MQDKGEMRIYSAGDIAKILDISTNAARDFLDQASKYNLFSVIKVGVQYRVNANQFDEWNTYAKLQEVCTEGTGGSVMDQMLVDSVCRSSRNFDFKDVEPVLVRVDPLNIDPPNNFELETRMIQKQAVSLLE